MPPRSSAKPSAPLRGKEAEAVLAQVVDISSSGLPLASGLRAAADEATPRRLAEALRHLARQLEDGVPLETALAEQARGYPAYVRGMVLAATRTGHVGTALDELIAHQRQAQSVWWQLIGSLLYPLLILGLGLLLLLLLLLVVVPPFEVILQDFALDLPASTVMTIRLSRGLQYLFEGAHKWISLGSVLGAIAAVWVVRAAIGPVLWRRVLGTLPLVGPLFAWSGAAAFARQLAVLVAHRVPLADALSLAAESIHDANVRQACLRYADGVQAGRQLSEMLESDASLPASLTPFVAWGERSQSLAEGLRTAGDVFFERMRMRSALLRSISPAVVFVLIGLFVILSISAITLPLFSLITALA